MGQRSVKEILPYVAQVSQPRPAGIDSLVVYLHPWWFCVVAAAGTARLRFAVVPEPGDRFLVLNPRAHDQFAGPTRIWCTVGGYSPQPSIAVCEFDSGDGEFDCLHLAVLRQLWRDYQPHIREVRGMRLRLGLQVCGV